MAKAISQSDTMWVKKGDKMPDGSIAKKGVVVQRSTGKAVTGAVKLVTKTTRGKAGDTLSLKGGRYTKSGSGTAKKTGSASVVKKAGSNPPAKKSVADSRAMSMRPGAKPAQPKSAPRRAASSGYQAGSSKSDYKAKPAWYEQGGGGLAGPNSPLANLKFSSGGKGNPWSTPPKKK